ncbi:MAG TPA: carbon-nitrogen hydrolase family protein [Candidatus Bilamarchaeum sp.]|nr:carbon-nitrogen hydrolase family protein [Candidatus Bilamarchaeum sp.]
MRIAIAQMEIAQGDVEANIAKIRKFIRKARAGRADVLVLPEYCLTGSVKGRPELIDSKGAYRRLFSNLAKKSRIDIVSGSFVESEKGKAYNTACYFERGGRLLGCYRKMNLWHSERERLCPGAEISVFNTRFGKAGLAICWDLVNPAIFRKMAQGGAGIIYVPSFWSDARISNYPSESKNIDALCFVRAFENECAIAYANAAGVYEPGDRLIGHSQLTVPVRGAVKLAAHSRESLLVAELPKNALARAAKVYKIRKDIRSGYQR